MCLDSFLSQYFEMHLIGKIKAFRRKQYKYILGGSTHLLYIGVFLKIEIITMHGKKNPFKSRKILNLGPVKQA